MPADNTAHLAIAARRRHELTRAKAIRALRELARAGPRSASSSSPGRRRVSGHGSTPSPTSATRSSNCETRPAAQHRFRPASQRPTHPSGARGGQAACERNRQLTEENRRLRRQLAEALGQRPERHALR